MWRSPRQRGPVVRAGGRLPPPMRAWLEQPHGRHHKAPPQPCALTTKLYYYYRCIAAGGRPQQQQQQEAGARRRFLLRHKRTPRLAVTLPRLVLVAVWMCEFRGLCVIAWLSLCTLASTRRVDSPSGGRVGETFQWLDDALAPLEGHCANYERRGAWWSYQWCHGRDVKQYHRNERGMAESEIILGTFDTVSTRTRRSGARRRVLYFSRVPSRWVAPRSRWATGV